MSQASGFDAYSTWRNGLNLPLRPDQAMVDRLCDLIPDHRDTVLVLGMTPELCRVGRNVTVVEWNDQVIARSPPPPGDNKVTVVKGDWREMDFAAGTFDSAVGDGSLSVIQFDADYRVLFDRLAGCLKPGAQLAIRCYVSPDIPETLDQVREDAMANRVETFQALKWRVAMAIAHRHGGNLPVTQILAAFDETFPDRAALADATGWTLEAIAEIDGYRAMPATSYSFVPLAQIRNSVPHSFADVRFESSGTYPLSDRCPYLIATRAD